MSLNTFYKHQIYGAPIAPLYTSDAYQRKKTEGCTTIQEVLKALDLSSGHRIIKIESMFFWCIFAQYSSDLSGAALARLYSND
jgi:hypothetical protein